MSSICVDITIPTLVKVNPIIKMNNKAIGMQNKFKSTPINGANNIETMAKTKKDIVEHNIMILFMKIYTLKSKFIISKRLGDKKYWNILLKRMT